MAHGPWVTLSLVFAALSVCGALGGSCDRSLCSSVADDCCAPLSIGEAATCRNGYVAQRTGNGCAGYGEGDYTCCSRDCADGYELIASGSLRNGAYCTGYYGQHGGNGDIVGLESCYQKCLADHECVGFYYDNNPASADNSPGYGHCGFCRAGYTVAYASNGAYDMYRSDCSTGTNCRSDICTDYAEDCCAPGDEPRGCSLAGYEVHSLRRGGDVCGLDWSRRLSLLEDAAGPRPAGGARGPGDRGGDGHVRPDDGRPQLCPQGGVGAARSQQLLQRLRRGDPGPVLRRVRAESARGGSARGGTATLCGADAEPFPAAANGQYSRRAAQPSRRDHQRRRTTRAVGRRSTRPAGVRGTRLRGAGVRRAGTRRAGVLIGRFVEEEEDTAPSNRAPQSLSPPSPRQMVLPASAYSIYLV